MASSLNKVRAGKFVGNGADKKVILGFKPKYVEIMNVTDQSDYKKSETMDDAKARKEIAAGTKTFVDSVSINADGFTLIAAEAVSAKTFHYVAYESKSDC
tara:strand:+ start:234 stop:533 length:300 start_codon:yes stop_codon:yes gene_type:complete